MTDAEVFALIQGYVDEINGFAEENFSAMLKPRLTAAGAEPLRADFTFTPTPWMRNIGGVMHGGISAAMVDLTMGLLAKVINGGRLAPTVDMTVTYHKPVPTDRDVFVEVKLVSPGNSVSSVSAVLRACDAPEKALVSAMGLYFTKK